MNIPALLLALASIALPFASYYSDTHDLNYGATGYGVFTVPGGIALLTWSLLGRHGYGKGILAWLGGASFTIPLDWVMQLHMGEHPYYFSYTLGTVLSLTFLFHGFKRDTDIGDTVTDDIRNAVDNPLTVNAHESASPGADSEKDIATESKLTGKLINGEYGLATTYWGFGVIGTFLITFPQGYAFAEKDMLLAFMLGLIAIIYLFILSLGIWESTEKYAGWSGWKLLAKFSIAVSIAIQLEPISKLPEQYSDGC